MRLARDLVRERRFDEADSHLERAHVLGQQDVGAHVRVHWQMLRIAVARRQPMSVLGQGLRIILGALGSAVGVVPAGNTGGTNVSMFAKMPIPADLQRVLRGGTVDRTTAPDTTRES